MTISFEQERQPSFKERVKQEREQEILQAARDVFSERGFEKTSIEDIAERVGIGKGTVYLHFASKEELLLALMRQSCLRLVDACRAASLSETGALGKLRRCVATIADHRYKNERWVGIVATEMPAFIGHKQKLGASSELRAFLSQVLEEGQAEGVVDARIRPPMAATAMLFLILASAGERISKPELIDAVSQLYFHGVTKEAIQ